MSLCLRIKLQEWIPQLKCYCMIFNFGTRLVIHTAAALPAVGRYETPKADIELVAKKMSAASWN